MATRPSKIQVSTVKRNQRFRGPALSAQQNDMQDELIRDITQIQSEYNNFLVPLTKSLPDGTVDSSLDAFRNGLDGQTLLVHQSAVNNAALSRYYNLAKGRPNSAFEQFQDVYSYVDAQLAGLEETVTSGTGSGSGLTTAQKERIGLNVFDNSLASSATSLDGKTDKNELNIIQLARDLYGASFVSFSVDGSGILANSNRTMVDALLELHSGNWDDDATVTHALDASSIVSGTFTQNRAGPSSGAPGGVNDSYVGTPANTVDDLNQIRTIIKNIKGTLSFSTTITPDGTWAPLTTPPNNFTNLIAMKGSAARSNTNPWGYDYTDVAQLSSIVSAENSYTGRTTITDGSPSYSSTYTGFTNGDSLVTAIGALAAGLGTVGGDSGTTASGLANHIANVSNPHQVTLTQAATQGGTAPADQITIVDVGAIYTSANVEDALQEIWTLTDNKLTTASGDLKSYIDAADAILTANIATASGEIVALDTRLDTAETNITGLQGDVSVIQTSSSHRRAEFSVTITTLSGVNLTHNAGMYPQVQAINAFPGPVPYIEPLSTVSGVWIEHPDTDSVTLTNYTGTTFSGIVVVNW